MSDTNIWTGRTDNYYTEERVKRWQPFHAAYYGRCPLCNEEIERGEAITGYPHGDFQFWVHFRCALLSKNEK